jgi:Domain of unknown function (DUF6285)
VTQHDRPTPRELVEAVREFVERELLPTLADRRLRFRALVALNALGIAARELAELPEREPDWELARRIRAGHVPEDALDRIKAEVEAKLRVASPKYLERDE